MSSFTFPPWISHPVPPEFVRKHSAHFTCCVRASAGNADLDRIVHDPDALLADGGKDSQNERLLYAGLGRRRGELLKTWVCRSRSERAGLYALALERARPRDSACVAWGERRRYGLAGWSYLLMEYVADGIDLGQRRGDRTAVIDRIGDLIGRLHEQGFTHRDLKPSNLLIAQDDRPYLIDLDGLRRVGRVSPARALADVVKLGRRMVELSTLSPREAAHFVRIIVSHEESLPGGSGGRRSNRKPAAIRSSNRLWDVPHPWWGSVEVWFRRPSMKDSLQGRRLAQEAILTRGKMNCYEARRARSFAGSPSLTVEAV